MSAATGRAGATADSASRCGCRRPSLRERFGDGPARALLDASSDTVTAIGDWCRDRGRGRLVRPVGLHVRVDGARLRRRRARGRGGRRRARGAATGWSSLTGAEVRARCDSPVPARRADPGLRDAAAGPAGARAAAAAGRARRAGVRALAGAGARGGTVGRRPPARQRARRRRGARVGRRPRAPLPGAAPAADGHLLAHRADRAGAGRDRGARLDRRRVHHRRAHAPALLPHHARRAHPARLGRRPAGLRRRA